MHTATTATVLTQTPVHAHAAPTTTPSAPRTSPASRLHRVLIAATISCIAAAAATVHAATPTLPEALEAQSLMQTHAAIKHNTCEDTRGRSKGITYYANLGTKTYGQYRAGGWSHKYALERGKGSINRASC